MLERVYSGEQTGAIQAEWRATQLVGTPTGGFKPLNHLAENGPRPDHATLYVAIEFPTADHSIRTRENVVESDADFWFGTHDLPGFKTIGWACLEFGRVVFRVIECTTKS